MSCKKSVNNDKICQGKDVFERMNFLYQASQLMSKQSLELSSFYGSLLTSCAKKAVLRLDHNLKRSLCKSCQCPLIPGKTAKYRLSPKNKKILCITCLICKKIKRIPMKAKYKLWMEQEQAMAELYDYTVKEPDQNDEDKQKEKVESSETN